MAISIKLLEPKSFQHASLLLCHNLAVRNDGSHSERISREREAHQKTPGVPVLNSIFGPHLIGLLIVEQSYSPTMPQPTSRVHNDADPTKYAYPYQQGFEQDLCGVFICRLGIVCPREMLLRNGHIEKLAQGLPSILEVHFQQSLLWDQGSDFVLMRFEDVCHLLSVLPLEGYHDEFYSRGPPCFIKSAGLAFLSSRPASRSVERL